MQSGEWSTSTYKLIRMATKTSRNYKLIHIIIRVILKISYATDNLKFLENLMNE